MALKRVSTAAPNILPNLNVNPSRSPIASFCISRSFCEASCLIPESKLRIIQTGSHRTLPTLTSPTSTSSTQPTVLVYEPATMEAGEAVQYLEGLLGRQLRVHTTDSRMFIGIFKCTDAVSKSPRKEEQLRAVLTWACYRNETSSSPTLSNTAILLHLPYKPLPPRRPSPGIRQKNPEMPLSRST